MQVEGKAGITAVSFGSLRIEPSGEARLVAYRSSGFGLVPGVNGLTLGYGSELVGVVFSPEDCRLVILEANSEQIAEIARILGPEEEQRSLCVVGEIP